MTVTEYATTPPRRGGRRPVGSKGRGGRRPVGEYERGGRRPVGSERRGGRRPVPDRERSGAGSAITARAAWGLVVAVLVCGAIAYAAATDATLSTDAAITLAIFVIAVWMWVCAPVDDTYVALGAALALVLTGPIETETFFDSLGDQLVWLLVGAFVLAAGLTASGLPTKVASRIVARARTPRQLFHLVCAALILTAFAVPSTSGRAALAVPIFVGLVAALRRSPRLVVALAVLFPTVILLSAVGSLLGAGAHIITSQLVTTATGEGFTFLSWMVLGLPLAVVWSHLAAEMVLLLFTTRADRAERLDVGDAESALPETASADARRRMTLVLMAVVALWCTEPLHGLDPALVALLGALTAVAPRIGATTIGAAVKTIPWSLLLFLAATLAIGGALVSTGAAEWSASKVFGVVPSGGSAVVIFVLLVVVLSLAAHLVVQSRSARSAVIVPLVIAVSPSVGVDPAAAAFVSTAAAGFCLTLTSSAKPVAMFAAVEGVPGFTPSHLLRLSAALAPISVALLMVFALYLWPLLGLSLTT